MLIGPPASGKSTLCKIFQGLDLESVDPDMRVNALKYTTARVIGAADCNPQDYDDRDILWINLTLPDDEREKRRAERDALHPSKRAQKHLGNFVIKGFNVRDMNAIDIGEIRELIFSWLGIRE